MEQILVEKEIENIIKKHNCLYKLFICVDGNICAGKSTVIKNICNKFKNMIDNNELTVIGEPIETWINSNGKGMFVENKPINILDLFQEERITIIAFQYYMVISLIEYQKKLIDENPNCKIFLMERSLFSTLAFIKTYKYKNYSALNNIEDNLIRESIKSLSNLINFKYDYYFVIKTDNIDVLYKRLKCRKRDGEGKLKKSYLNDLENAYLEFYKNKEYEMVK